MVHFAFCYSKSYSYSVSLGDVEIVTGHVQYRDDSAKGDAFVAVDKRVVVVDAVRDDRSDVENGWLVAVVDQALRPTQGSLEPPQVANAGIASELVDVFLMCV